MKRATILTGVALAVGLGACERSPEPTSPVSPAPQHAASAATMRVNVLLNQRANDAILAELASYGTLRGRIDAVNAVFLNTSSANLSAIQRLSYVKAAGPDAERQGSPVDRVPVESFASGINSWDQDAVNVTDFGSPTRTVALDGSGVFVAILDTGLLDTWRQYFPQERIATQYARAFVGADPGTVAESPNLWEHDTDSHGTHVTSSVLGYNLRGTPVNGTAPRATVIPVKVLGQSGWGWTSVIAQGITYIADLKAGPLAGSPVVINMSLGGGRLDAVEQAALDYAIAKGVIVVAAAGNEGDRGMGYPAAYAPVISVAASGWIKEWANGRSWWNSLDVAEPVRASDFYITDFSSRAKPGQDLDVAAPGSWIVGPYQLQSGRTSYFFLGGTSMASPHVAGIVALMAQKKPGLTAAEAEQILERSAIALPPGCRSVLPFVGEAPVQYCWGADATGAGLATADAALKRLR